MTQIDPNLLSAAFKRGGTFSEAARILKRDHGINVGRDTVRRQLLKHKPVEALPVYSREPVEPINIEELLAERIRKFERKEKAYLQDREVDLYVDVDGPIGLGFFGDLHVDDDGTDIKLAFEHADLFDGRQEALFAANVGDLWNNWIGSLKRLWENQSTSGAEAKLLLEHWLAKIAWLMFIKGNHDEWSGTNDPLDYILKGKSIVTRGTRCQVNLHFPNGRVFKIYIAHDFKGKSMYTSSFGPAKKAQFHRQADLYICGHLHDSAYQHGFHPDGRMWHAMRLGSYKKIDDYAEKIDVEPNHGGYVCPVAIIDPYADLEINRVRWELDPKEGAKRLAQLRQEWKAKK
jgi:UDP-2,3-diacylglucosamine pyrophosphatase LpxH